MRMNLNYYTMKIKVIFFLLVIIFVSSTLTAQTMLQRNKLIFSNDGGFEDTLNTDIEVFNNNTDLENTNYLDMINWFIATANILSENYGTINVTITEDNFFTTKHLFAGKLKEGSVNATIEHYEGVSNFDYAINADFSNTATITNQIFAKDITTTAASIDVAPFISDLIVGTSKYENLLHIHSRSGMAGGSKGIVIEPFGAVDINYDSVNPRKLGLQMEGGNFLAGSMFVSKDYGKVLFADTHITTTDASALSDTSYSHLHVFGNVELTGSIYGKIGSFISYKMHPYIDVLCYDRDQEQTYYVYKFINDNPHTDGTHCKPV